MPKNYKIKDEDIKIAVKSNTSASATLRYLNLRTAGGNYNTLYKAIERLNLDNSHWRSKPNFISNSWNIHKKGKPLSEILVENSFYNNGRLKTRLLKEKILHEHCYECGIEPVWNNKPLILQLDHINGIHIDNRLENLRLLCPNCHTQTHNYAGKTLDKKCKKCKNCKANISPKATYCINCSNKYRHKTSE